MFIEYPDLKPYLWREFVSFRWFCTKTQLRGGLDHTLSATLFVGPRQSRFVLKKIWVVTAPGGRHTQDIKLSLMGSK